MFKVWSLYIFIELHLLKVSLLTPSIKKYPNQLQKGCKNSLKKPLWVGKQCTSYVPSFFLSLFHFFFLLGTNVTVCKTPFSCLNHYGPQSIFARPSIAGRRKEVLFQLHLFLLLIGILCASALAATCKENCHRHIQYTV